MYWLVIILGYLLGSIPISYIAGRIITGRDIRKMGDENAGAANVYREVSPATGIVVGVIDAAKGSATVLFAMWVGMSQPVVLTAGLAAFIGHNWPVFLGFRGGRGLATALGILLVLVTVPVLILALPTILVLMKTRHVSLAMVFFFVGFVLLGWLFKVQPVLMAYGIALPIFTGLTTLFRERHKRLKAA